MAENKDLTASVLQMYHLLHRYHLIWYGKNYGGMDPWQGQGRILMSLHKGVPITQKELGFTLELRPQSMGELLQKLEANGYIVRYRSKEDKRALMIELTKKGEKFQKTKPDYEDLFIGLNKAERVELQKSLDKISIELRDWLEKEIAESIYYEGQNYPTFKL